MLMDIACPAELMHVEQAIFGGGRRQAYLTFLNESDRAIIGITGLCAFRSAQGKILHKTRLTFDDLHAAPGSTFTCHLALDGYPEFREAEMIVEGVLFEAGEPWEMNPGRLIDCTPPALPEGPERVALIALAGPDAVCFPERHELLWICVCGRYNRLRWLSCRRCGRGRDEVFSAYTPEAARKSHQERVAESRVRDRTIQQENVQRRAAQRRQAAERAALLPPEPEQAGRGALRVAAMVLAIALAVIGVGLFLRNEARISEKLDYPSLTPSFTMPPVDYLQPL